GNPCAQDRRPMAPHPQRHADPIHGHPRLQSEGLVDLPGRTRLEGRGALPCRPAKMRLPRLRRGRTATSKHQGNQAHGRSTLTACAQQENYRSRSAPANCGDGIEEKHKEEHYTMKKKLL